MHFVQEREIFQLWILIGADIAEKQLREKKDVRLAKETQELFFSSEAKESYVRTYTSFIYKPWNRECQIDNHDGICSFSNSRGRTAHSFGASKYVSRKFLTK